MMYLNEKKYSFRDGRKLLGPFACLPNTTNFTFGLAFSIPYRNLEMMVRFDVVVVDDLQELIYVSLTGVNNFNIRLEDKISFAACDYKYVSLMLYQLFSGRLRFLKMTNSKGRVSYFEESHTLVVGWDLLMPNFKINEIRRKAFSVWSNVGIINHTIYPLMTRFPHLVEFSPFSDRDHKAFVYLSIQQFSGHDTIIVNYSDSTSGGCENHTRMYTSSSISQVISLLKAINYKLDNDNISISIHSECMAQCLGSETKLDSIIRHLAGQLYLMSSSGSTLTSPAITNMNLFGSRLYYYSASKIVAYLGGI